MGDGTNRAMKTMERTVEDVATVDHAMALRVRLKQLKGDFRLKKNGGEGWQQMESVYCRLGSARSVNSLFSHGAQRETILN